MKIAISLPDPIFAAAEQLAQQRQIPRSQLYAEALSDYLGLHSATAITTKLNEVYATASSPLDGALAQAQLRALNHEAW